MVDLTPYREKILTYFNEMRNDVAGGKLETFPIAARMAHMKWGPELAFLAEMNVKTCRNQYDKCRSTHEYPYAGQAIAKYSYSGPENSFSDDEIIKEKIEEWLDENQNTIIDYINAYPATSPEQ